MNLSGEVQSLEDNPCIGWCTTRQFGDERCKGCGRYEIEVRDWNRMPKILKKLRVLQNSEEGYPIRHAQPHGWRPTPKVNIGGLTHE